MMAGTDDFNFDPGDTEPIYQLLEDQSPHDLELWMGTHFFKAMLSYYFEDIAMLRRDIIAGKPSADYESVDQMRGALKAFTKALTTMPISLAEDLQIALKARREREQQQQSQQTRGYQHGSY